MTDVVPTASKLTQFTRLAHAGPALLVLMFTLLVFGELVVPVDLVVRVVMAVAWFATVFATILHMSRGCVRCGRLCDADTAEIDALVDRHRWALWLHHKRWGFAGAGVLYLLSLPFDEHTVLHALLSSGCVVSFGFVLNADMRHQLLRAHCPHCAHRGR